MKIAKPTYNDLLFIAQNMREWDRREIYATEWDEDPVSFTNKTLAISDCSWIFGLERPIATIGAWPVWPGHWRVWMYGTNEFGQIGKRLTKFAQKTIIPAIVVDGFVRAECYSMVGHEEAHKWLRHLGAKPEATVRQYGKGGEDFIVYRWLQEDVERYRQARAA